MCTIIFRTAIDFFPPLTSAIILWWKTSTQIGTCYDTYLQTWNGRRRMISTLEPQFREQTDATEGPGCGKTKRMDKRVSPTPAEHGIMSHSRVRACVRNSQRCFWTRRQRRLRQREPRGVCWGYPAADRATVTSCRWWRGEYREEQPPPTHTYTTNTHNRRRSRFINGPLRVKIKYMSVKPS